MISAFSGLRGGWAASPAPFVDRGSVIVWSVSVADAEDPLGLLDDLGDPERLAPDAVVALGVDQELAADEQQQLAEVDLRDQHPAVAPEDLLGIRREGIEVAQVGMGDAPALEVESLDG